jgi:hypothetical protein
MAKKPTKAAGRYRAPRIPSPKERVAGVITDRALEFHTQLRREGRKNIVVVEMITHLTGDRGLIYTMMLQLADLRRVVKFYDEKAA